MHEAPGETILSWTTQPVRLNPFRAAVAAAAICLTWFLAVAAFGSILMACVGSLAVLGSMVEALFPTHHRLSSSGAFTRCGWQMRQMTWSSVRSARMGRDGIHLSPFRDGAPLGRVRGITLRFDDVNEANVTDIVRRYITRKPA